MNTSAALIGFFGITVALLCAVGADYYAGRKREIANDDLEYVEDVAREHEQGIADKSKKAPVANPHDREQLHALCRANRTIGPRPQYASRHLVIPLFHRRLRVSCFIQILKIVRLKLRNAGRLPVPHDSLTRPCVYERAYKRPRAVFSENIAGVFISWPS
jgi:hypothetical protein